MGQELPPGSTVWGYLRVSSEAQAEKGTPLVGQRRALRQYCRQHNLHLARTFVDEARSGGTVAGRDAFNDMLTLAQREPRPADGILIWSWSRFAREEDDAHFFKASLRRRGYALLSLTDNVPEGDFQYIFEALVHWKDAQYLRDLRKAVKRGHHTLAERGYSPGGFPPVGYKTVYEDVEVGGKTRKVRRWVEDPDTWNRVRLAWKMKAEGATLREIHAATRLLGASNSYVYMFRNRHYLGLLRWGEVEIEGAIPAAVDRATWDAVQARRQPHVRVHPRRAASPHLLTGLACCAYCGRALAGTSQTSGGFRLADGRRLKVYSRKLRHYRCGLANQDRTACQGIGYPRALALESAVLEAVTTRILAPDNLADLLQAQAAGDLERIVVERATLETKKRETDQAVSRLLDAVEHQGWSPALSDRLSERELERERLDTQLAALENRLALYNQFADQESKTLQFSHEALAILSDALAEEMRADDPRQVNRLLKKFIVRVEVGQTTLTLHYTFPLTGHGLQGRHLGVSNPYTIPLTHELTVAWKP